MRIGINKGNQRPGLNKSLLFFSLLLLVLVLVFGEFF
jgi:hypothetical protein